MMMARHSAGNLLSRDAIPDRIAEEFHPPLLVFEEFMLAVVFRQSTIINVMGAFPPAVRSSWSKSSRRRVMISPSVRVMSTVSPISKTSGAAPACPTALMSAGFITPRGGKLFLRIAIASMVIVSV